MKEYRLVIHMRRVFFESKSLQDVSHVFVEKSISFWNLMVGKLLKENDRPKNEHSEMLDLIKKTKRQWNQAMDNYEFADDKDIIDYYIYQIKAFQVQYCYLLKKAKGMGIRSEIITSAI